MRRYVLVSKRARRLVRIKQWPLAIRDRLARLLDRFRPPRELDAILTTVVALFALLLLRVVNKEVVIVVTLRRIVLDEGLIMKLAFARRRRQPKQPAAMPTEHGYTRQDDGAVVISASDQATLDQMLLQRVIAKRTRDFAQADQLRDQLRDLNCMLDDHASTYRIVLPRQKRGPPPMPTDLIKRSSTNLDLLLRRMREQIEVSFSRSDGYEPS